MDKREFISPESISAEFEQEVRAAMSVPEADQEFLGSLKKNIILYQPRHSIMRQPFFTRPAWVGIFGILILIVIAFLAIGPQRVIAAVGQMLGYIPGVGIVDQNTPIRVLEEPVSITRDGITVSVNQAYLTAEKTVLDTGISGVPLSAYPKNEAETGCIDREYLRLPDGTSQDVAAPIPASVNEAVYALPCIPNTIPSAAPTEWELTLRFIPASPDLTVLPVIEVPPSAPVPTGELATVTEEPLETAEAPASALVTVEKVVETEDGYILIGAVKPQVPEGSWLQITGSAVIRDAEGKKVNYSYPTNWQALAGPSFNQGGDTWALQIKGAGVSFPVMISYGGVVISQVDPTASAQIPFDAGPDPQPEQVWMLNQDVQLAGHTVRLISVTAYEDGYSFRIDPGPSLSSLSVQIDGYQPDGGGGGGGSWGGIFNTSLAYSELPKGALTLVLSKPLAASPTETWHGQWQPETPRVFAPSAEESASPVCLTAEALSVLQPLPAGLDGKMLLTELNPAQQILLADLDGSQRQVLVSGSGRGALSPDGARLAYSNEEGITIVELSSGERTVLLDAKGIELHWSPDGNQLAYTAAEDAYGVFVVDREGQASPRQLSNLGYESIAGWSPDGKELYFAIPSSTNDGFLLRAAEVTTGEVSDLFVLEDSSGKAPMPTVSPDGNWIAYRGSDNSSLYLVRMDGSEGHKVIELPSSYAITGIAWGPGSGLLGVSLITPDTPDGVIVLMQPDNCETYLLPNLTGMLEGFFIP